MIINKMLNLTHGEVYVILYEGKKSIRFSDADNPVRFRQELHVQLANAFDEITITVVAYMGQFGKWVLDKEWALKDKGVSESWQWANELAQELEHHGFMEELEKAIN